MGRTGWVTTNMLGQEVFWSSCPKAMCHSSRTRPANWQLVSPVWFNWFEPTDKRLADLAKDLSITSMVIKGLQKVADVWSGGIGYHMWPGSHCFFLQESQMTSKFIHRKSALSPILKISWLQAQPPTLCVGDKRSHPWESLQGFQGDQGGSRTGSHVRCQMPVLRGQTEGQNMSPSMEI